MGTVYDVTCRNCGVILSDVWCGRGMIIDSDSKVTEIMVCPNCEKISVITKRWTDFRGIRCSDCGEIMVNAEYLRRPLKCPKCGEHSAFLHAGLMFD